MSLASAVPHGDRVSRWLLSVPSHDASRVGGLGMLPNSNMNKSRLPDSIESRLSQQVDVLIAISKLAVLSYGH